MKSFIIQISLYPIVEDEYIKSNGISDGNMTSIESCMIIPQTERSQILKNLVNLTLPEGMFSLNPDIKSLTYRGGFTDWNRKYVSILREKGNAINETNVFKFIGPTYQLEKNIANPLNTDVLFITDFTQGCGMAELSRELMRVVSNLLVGAKLYVGAIFSYHY